MTNPVVQNYVYNLMGRHFGSYALGQAEYVPSPFDDMERGYFQYPIGTPAPTVEQPEIPEASFDESVDYGGGDGPSSSTSPGSKAVTTGIQGKINKQISKLFEAKFGVPKALDPLTGTVRASGPPAILSMMTPPFISGLMGLGAKMSKANLMNLAEMSVAGFPGYSTALMGNQMVGVQPTDTTIGGILLESLGFDIEGYTLSGNIGSFTNVDQKAYEDALVTSLLYNKPTLRSPIEALNLGFDPGQSVYRQTEIQNNVATLLGIDPFGPNFAATPSFQSFADDRGPGGLPGSIVGSYDQFGNWAPVTSGMSGFAFSGMMPGTSKAKLEDAGFYFHTTPSGQFEMYSPDTGWGAGGGKGSPHDYTADSQVKQSGLGTSGGSGPSFDDSSLGKGGGGGSSPSSGGGDYGGGQEARGVAQGGRVGYAPGGNVTNGFVNKDPDSVTEQESIADNRHTSVKEGSFIVNQPTNEKYEGMLDSLVAKAQKKVKKPKDAPMVDVALSDGERHIEPEVVAEIEKMKGKGFLDKLNNKGKPEVKRRQAKYGGGVGLNEGGFLEQGMEVQDVGDDIPMQDYAPVSDELISKLSKFAKKKPQRSQIKEFIKGLSDEDKLTVLFLTETQSTTDPIESMEAIGEVVQNRMASDYYDFKDIKTLDDALLKQTRRGAFHFSGLEPSTLFARAKEVKKGLASKGLAKATAAAQNVLDPETEGNRRLPVGTVFYTRKDAPSQWMRESKDLEFSTELGGHEFYRTFITREFP